MSILERELMLPSQKKVPILTTETDSWIPQVAYVVTNPDPTKRETVLLQSGDGPYVLGTGIYISNGDSAIRPMHLINRQKARPQSQLVALGIPPEEMAIWTAEPYKPLVESLTGALRNEVFGVIVPASDKLLKEFTNYDITHGIREKLMVWCDKTDTGPVAKLFKYIRDVMGLPPDEFTMLFTSGNKHGKGTNIRFTRAYEQLGDEDDLAYAVMDIEEDKYAEGSPPIISVLPFVIGRDRFLVVKARRGIDDLQDKIPNLEQRSRTELALESLEYRLTHRVAA